MAPDAAAFDMLTLLGPTASIVSDAVRLFICQPVVITTRRCVQTPIVDFDTIELSDRHCVAVDLLPLCRDIIVYVVAPAFTPSTVTLVAPVAAAFVILVPLAPAASTVSDAVKLFICQPVVTTLRRWVQTPIASLVVTDVSDRQCVISAFEPPTRDGLL